MIGISLSRLEPHRYSKYFRHWRALVHRVIRFSNDFANHVTKWTKLRAALHWRMAHHMLRPRMLNVRASQLHNDIARPIIH